MKIVRPKLQKSREEAETKDFGGAHFLTVFCMAKKLNFGSKMGPNHSGSNAREPEKIEKKTGLLLRRCFLVLEGVSGRVFRRF